MTKLIAIKEIIPILLIVIMFLVGIAFYSSPCLPDRMPTHWSATGEVDGFSSKGFAVFFFPAVTLAVYLLMLFIPFIDPLRENYKKFAGVYYGFRLVLVLFFCLLYFYTLAAGLGFKMNINFFIIPLLSLLFIAIGFFLPKMKKNWFCGIRTPWTLQSDEVWEKTHQFGGKSFIVAGILSLLSVFSGSYALWVFIVIILGGAFIPAFYSYFLYRKLGLFEKSRK